MTPLARTDSNSKMTARDWNSLLFYDSGMDAWKNPTCLSPNIVSTIIYFSASSALGYDHVTGLLRANEMAWKSLLSDNPTYADIYWQQAIMRGQQLAMQYGGKTSS